jgi:hypothetical protein
MPLLITEFSSLPGEDVSGPGGAHGDLNGLEGMAWAPAALTDQGAELVKHGKALPHATGVGSGSDAGNSSGTEPSTTTGTSDLRGGRSGGSSSASDNDAESCTFGGPSRGRTRSSGAASKKSGGSSGSAFSRKFALAKEIARSLSAFDRGCLLHDVHISHEGVDTLESLNLILKDFITTHPQTQFFKVDACDDGIMVRLKKGGWVLSQED